MGMSADFSTNAIELKNIVKEYPGVKALKNISFEVKKGAVHGFLGPNGAGKSTTMRIITGILKSEAGEVHLPGNPKIGFLPENPPLYMNMQVEDYLNFVKRIYELKNKSDVSVSDVMEKCGLTSVAKRMIGNLSKGYKQRVGIAQTLVYGPEIIILDEPTVGLDPHSIEEIRTLILELKKDHTILLSTHQLHEASLMCTDITVINQGQVLQTGPIKEIEKSLQAKQVINVELLPVSEVVLSNLEKEESIDRVEVKNQADKTFVKVFVESDEDFRPELSKFFMQNDCTLLGMSEEKLNLEDIFKKLTSNGESHVC